MTDNIGLWVDEDGEHPIEEMSREQLIKVVYFLHREIAVARHDLDRALNSWKAFQAAR